MPEAMWTSGAARQPGTPSSVVPGRLVIGAEHFASVAARVRLIARAAKNVRAMRWMRRLPMPAWRALLRLVVRLATRRAVDRQYWRGSYRSAIAPLTWLDLESRDLVSIGIDEGGVAATPELAGWRGRLLVLEGARDRVVRRSTREALRATYPNASFHACATAGHAPALEVPDEWLLVVTNVLRGEGLRARA